MAEETVPVDKAIAVLDDWAGTIAGHIATDRNLVRARLEARHGLGTIEAIAKAAPPMTPAMRQSFYRAAGNLLSVVRPLLSPADRAACDRLASVLEGKGD